MKTIEDIRQRCVITDDGHWLWKGSTRPDGRPNIWAPDYTRGGMSTQCGTRAVWHCITEKAIPAGWRAFGTCEPLNCCNPAHVKCGSEAYFGAWLQRTGKFKGQVRRILANRATSRGRSVLTLELITHIQTSPKLGYELAAELGISTTSVSKARRGDAIVFQSAGVFSGLMQGTRETTHAGRA
jgi:hypothetical protein